MASHEFRKSSGLVVRRFFSVSFFFLAGENRLLMDGLGKLAS